VHGIGVGLHFYLPFLAELEKHCKETGVGLIALEVLAICNRMTGPLPTPDEIAEAITRILDYHGWEKCVLVTHSYGSALAAHIMRYPAAREKIGPMVFVDPVAFSFHPPDVAWNFLRRQPRTASQWQLWYFASMDPDVARTLTRNFRWADSSLWRDDLEERVEGREEEDMRVTVMVSGADIITDVPTLGEYLIREPGKQKWYHSRKAEGSDQAWMEREWTGKDLLEVVYVPGLNHAEIFEEETPRHLLKRIIEAYTAPRHVQSARPRVV
jgi:pimeloyl-ACP methyl ester carboxylesterase